MTANSLIDFTLEEIARDYQPGTLVWMKANRPNEWASMVTLERGINKSAIENDFRGLRKVLHEYQRLIFSVGKEVRNEKEKERIEV